MNIHTTKKASKIISTFSQREKITHDYLIELYKNTVEKIEKCTKEIEVYKNDKPIYRQTIKSELDAEFRLKYICQCLGLSVNYDYETKILKVASNKHEDKDN